MDNAEYLKQISQKVRPEKKSMEWLSSPIFKVVVGGIIVFIIIMIVGPMITSGNASMKERIISLKLHIENTMGVVSGYRTKLKSSNLRSSSVSFSSVLSSTNDELDSYIAKKYSNKQGSEIDSIKEEAAMHKDELETDLYEAKINGVLDRIFAHKMALEISLITAEESSIYNASNDEVLKSILENSYNNLDSLYDSFDKFSETK